MLPPLLLLKKLRVVRSEEILLRGAAALVDVDVDVDVVVVIDDDMLLLGVVCGGAGAA